MPFMNQKGLSIQIEKKLIGWNKEKLSVLGAHSIYVFLCVMAIAPVIDAARSGFVNAIPLLVSLCSTVGANLISTLIQQWKDEANAAREIEKILNDPEKRRDILPSLDAILQKYEVLEMAGRCISTDEKSWYTNTLQQELFHLGNWSKYSNALNNDGIIQGPKTVIITEGSQYIENPHNFSTINGPFVKKGGDYDQ
jgi:hypothetical protein